MNKFMIIIVLFLTAFQSQATVSDSNNTTENHINQTAHLSTLNFNERFDGKFEVYAELNVPNEIAEKITANQRLNIKLKNLPQDIRAEVQDKKNSCKESGTTTVEFVGVTTLKAVKTITKGQKGEAVGTHKLKMRKILKTPLTDLDLSITNTGGENTGVSISSEGEVTVRVSHYKTHLYDLKPIVSEKGISFEAKIFNRNFPSQQRAEETITVTLQKPIGDVKSIVLKLDGNERNGMSSYKSALTPLSPKQINGASVSVSGKKGSQLKSRKKKYDGAGAQIVDIIPDVFIVIEIF